MTQNQPPTDPKARAALQESYLRIAPFGSACILWDRVLTAAQRQQLGDDVEGAFRKHGTLGMWMKLYGVTPYRACLEVARAVNLLSENDYQWLRREIGEPAEPGMPDRPHWNHIDGRLHYGKMDIRQVRRNKRPTNIQIILDAFQAANWTPKIANPLDDSAQKLHDTLRALNRTLKQIRFHSLEGGKAIHWQPNSR